MIISKDDRQFIKIPDKISTSQTLYTIDDTTGRLGAGGNAAVYECVDRQGNNRAIKFLLNFSDKQGNGLHRKLMFYLSWMTHTLLSVLITENSMVSILRQIKIL